MYMYEKTVSQYITPNVLPIQYVIDTSEPSSAYS